jgi:hypothetical protein
LRHTKWGRWLYEVTGEDKVRGVARAAGVSHTTVARWIENGVPPERVAELTVKFGADPIAGLVLIGWLREEDVARMNYAAVVQYAPADVLAAELLKRATRYIAAQYPDTLRKTRTGLDDGPQVDDVEGRMALRLTSKN